MEFLHEGRRFFLPLSEKREPNDARMNPSPFPIPSGESNRLQLLAGYQVAGTPPEVEYDRFAHLAAKLFNAPVAMLTFVEAERVCIKAKSGIDVCELKRGDGFCAYTIMADRVFVIPDTKKDERFARNAVVVGPPHVRFYAGAPLLAEPGHAIGTLCIVDVVPRPPLTDHEQRILGDLASMVMDRLEKRRLELAEREARERFLKIAETSPDAIVCSDDSGRIIFWNGAAEDIFGIGAAEAFGGNLERLVAVAARPAFGRWLAKVQKRLPGKFIDGHAGLDCRRASGTEFPAEISYSSWNEAGRFVICSIIRDVTARCEAEERLRDLARRDPLTRLPNRAAFLERLDAAIRTARATDSGCSLLLIDLDHFKDVNDALGHGAGDRLLQRLSERLSAFTSESVHVSRLSGDEFTIILEGEGDAASASVFAERIRRALRHPLRIHDQQVDIDASIGVATFPSHASTASDLLANADLALYRAKGEGGERTQLYVSALRDAAMSRRQVENELRNALREHQFILHYQPQVAVRDGRVVGAEALLRWRHPEQGILLPASFLAVLETSPLAASTGAWAIETAVAQAALWMKSLGRPIRMGVNLFASQFIDGELAASIIATLARHQLPPECLELEITENIALRHDGGVATPLRRLIDAGVGIAFDDFGTGYGSLSYLKRVPVTRLKIDRSFVKGILTDPGDAAIVRAVVALGQSLGLGVVAEGVETEAQRAFLETLGCPEAQGHLFGQPMSGDEFELLLTGAAERQVA